MGRGEETAEPSLILTWLAFGPHPSSQTLRRDQGKHLNQGVNVIQAPTVAHGQGHHFNSGVASAARPDVASSLPLRYAARP